MTIEPEAGGAERNGAFRRQVFLAGWALLSPALLTSCGQKDADSLYPVQGKVLYKNRPAAGARIVFHLLGGAVPGQPTPQATVEADGTFRVSSRIQNDGALPGKYAVTITWPSDRKTEEDGTAAGPDRLRGRYANPKTTPLRAEVGPHDNQLEPIVLK